MTGGVQRAPTGDQRGVASLRGWTDGALIPVFLGSTLIVVRGGFVPVAGIVGFVGLIVPDVVRNIVGSDYEKLIVGSVFAGPALTVAADVGARLALNPVQVPVGIVTGLVGGPDFLHLMRKQDRMGEI